MASLIDKLKAYSAQNIVPMHMPGHKRLGSLCQDLPYGLDITEIEDFDDLHYSNGILADLANDCAALYGSDQAYPLVNGSTCGILAAIRAATNPGDNVIVARNCHKSVYHALELNQLQATYIQPAIEPGFGINANIDPVQLSDILEQNNDVSLVIITSPTYEGVVSDIKSLADIAHQYHVPLFVDAAHGAHLGFSTFFPENPLALGADLVVMSLHKTLPALTQTALLHLKSQSITAGNITRELAIFESSSPSYILLASIDRCVDLLQTRHEELFASYVARLQQLVKSLQKLTHLTYLDDKDHPLLFAVDPGKIVISTKKTDISGPALAAKLKNDWQIEVEMVATDYIIAMTSIFDSEENFDRLAKALRHIDAGLMLAEQYDMDLILPLPKQAYSIAQAKALKPRGVLLPFAEAADKICLEYITAYPPAIPLLVPGETVSAAMICYIKRISNSGVTIHSDNRAMPQLIRVL